MFKNKIFYWIIIFIFFVVVSSCTDYNNYKNYNKTSVYEKLAKEKYTDNINFIFSSDSLFVVCTKSLIRSKTDPKIQYRFFVFDINKQKMIFEDNSLSDYIEWVNNRQIQVLKRPGIITVDPKKNKKLLGYVYDINKDKKLPLSGPNENTLQ